MIWHAFCNEQGMKKKFYNRAFKRNARPILAGLAAGLCFIWAQNTFAASDQHIGKEAKTCSQAIQYQERRQHIPKGLLNAVSQAESGRWDATNRETFAWPWTVTSGGVGHFLPNRADAVAFVKSLQADGVENIDVGCLQINLKYHPQAFVSLEHAFDPVANAAYASDFLAERFAVSKSWLKAVGDYHSTTPALNKSYRKQVAKIWHKNKHKNKSAITSRTKMASLKLYPPSHVALDAGLTKRFNQSFQNRASMGRPGQVIANRVNALKPGARLNRTSGKKQSSAFAAKRQSQLMAWRNANGGLPLMPVIPAAIKVQ